jgi:hypothetical protein
VVSIDQSVKIRTKAKSEAPSLGRQFGQRPNTTRIEENEPRAVCSNAGDLGGFFEPDLNAGSTQPSFENLNIFPS